MTYIHLITLESVARLQLQIGEALQFLLYGDSAYIVSFLSHIKARHDYEPNTEREMLENSCMSSCRECIEWDYGDVCKLWANVDFPKGLKIRSSMRVARVFLLAIILRNAHNTMNGCETADYYGILPPTFEQWIQQGPRNNNNE